MTTTKFRDGDYVTSELNGEVQWIGIYKRTPEEGYAFCYCALGKTGLSEYPTCWENNLRLSTFDEKMKLDDALHRAMKQWNAEEKRFDPFQWKPKPSEEYWYLTFDNSKMEFIKKNGIYNPLDFEESVRIDNRNCYPNMGYVTVLADRMNRIFKEQFRR